MLPLHQNRPAVNVNFACAQDLLEACYLIAFMDVIVCVQVIGPWSMNFFVIQGMVISFFRFEKAFCGYLRKSLQAFMTPITIRIPYDPYEFRPLVKVRN